VVAHYALMKRIGAKGERVILNGQGADEIGAGYDKFYLPYLKEQWRKNKFTAGGEAMQIARNLKIAPDQFTNRFSRLLGSESLNRFLAPELLEAVSSFQRLPDSDIRQTSVNLLTEALLLPAAAEFAAAVLSRRRSVHYPTVWRWWAWANFARLLREA